MRVTGNGGRGAVAAGGRLDVPEFANHLSHTLMRTARLLRQLGHDGVSASQSTALMMIDRFGPLPISELAVIENIARPTASSLVAKLESEGHVRRLEVPNDGRISLVELTPAGRRVIERARTRRDSWLAERLRSCTPAEVEALRTAARVLDEISIGADHPWDLPHRGAESLTAAD
jgi:DNA-binding MarR family transcriptional regulator